MTHRKIINDFIMSNIDLNKVNEIKVVNNSLCGFSSNNIYVDNVLKHIITIGFDNSFTIENL
jgi:hypothetical protein